MALKGIKRLAVILSAGAALLSFGGCAAKTQRYTASFLDVFDTASTVVAYAEEESEFQDSYARYHALLQEYNRLFDIYNDYEGIANLKTINDKAGIEPVEVDGKIIDLLKFGKEIYTLSGGRVNICFGSVLSVWHDYRDKGLSDPEEAALPPLEALEAAALHTDIENLEIDEDAGTVFLADPDMRLDVGAIAKGYAAQKAAEAAFSDGLVNAAFSIGGNVTTLGNKEGRKNNPWIIGLENPDGGDYLMTLALSDVSVVTSGDYQRYYEVDGVRYHHIIDPSTLMPAVNCRAVSVVGDDSGLCDGLSTALFLMPVEDGLSFVESLPEIEALWIQNDGSILKSSGFDQYINE